MTLKLRALHRFVWWIMAIALPVIWWTAAHRVSDGLDGLNIARQIPEPLPVVKVQKATSDWIVSFRADSSDTYRQLEILLLKPINAPALTAYWNETPLGYLSNKGLYRFPITSQEAKGYVSIRTILDKEVVLSMDF